MVSGKNSFKDQSSGTRDRPWRPWHWVSRMCSARTLPAHAWPCATTFSKTISPQWVRSLGPLCYTRRNLSKAYAHSVPTGDTDSVLSVMRAALTLSPSGLLLHSVTSHIFIPLLKGTDGHSTHCAAVPSAHWKVHVLSSWCWRSLTFLSESSVPFPQKAGGKQPTF